MPPSHLSSVIEPANSVSDANWNRSEWRTLAACAAVDTSIFFPTGLTGKALRDAGAAKAMCASCPVQGPCLEFALRTLQDYGVWGGKDEEERRSIRRARRAAARFCGSRGTELLGAARNAALGR